MGLATGDLTLAESGALRWAIDAGRVVVVVSLLVFAWKRATVQRRGMAFEQQR